MTNNSMEAFLRNFLCKIREFPKIGNGKNDVYSYFNNIAMDYEQRFQEAHTGHCGLRSYWKL